MIPRVRGLGQGQGFRVRCPACEALTRHHPAVAAGEPDRVRCDRCGRIHLGGPGEGETIRGAQLRSVAAPPPPPHRRRVPDGVEQQWHDRLAGADPDGAVVYRTDRVLAAGQWVDHPVFGLGLVHKLIPPATAEVHFQQGFKRLRCRV